MHQEKRINFLIVESQPLLRHSLVKFLENQEFTGDIYSLDNCSKLANELKSRPVHCIIFDPLYDLSTASKITSFLKESYPNIYIIAYSMNTSLSYIRLFNKMNIKGVVSRLDSIEILQSALVAAVKGFEFKKSVSYNQEHKVQLSAREITVLKLLTEGHRNKEVARRLNISDKTVSTYKKRVLDKFNVSSIMDILPKDTSRSFVV
ncbi:response regulator transcription factor [Vibrio sp. TRT 1302]|uniref:helix-turn-helix transcriptional regulator n=1 Tax=Vibrio sp. TRT 1302 TaxID=3418504 RepID=UPI003CF8EDCC